MPRAILKGGVIYPVDPLPADWEEGTEVSVERLPVQSPNGAEVHSTDRWMDEVEALAAQISEDEDDKLDAAIAAIRQEAKALARQGKR